MENLLSVSAVIFDVDGTLVDSNDYQAQAFEEAFRAFGHCVDVRTIRPLIGLSIEKLIPRALGRPCTEHELDSIGKCKTDLFLKKYLAYVRPFPKVRDMVDWLQSWNMGLAVTSSSATHELHSLLKVACLEDHFGDAATETVQMAVKRLAEPKERMIVVGDSPYDIEAGMRAGIQAIALRSGGWSDSSLCNAAAIYDGVWDLYDTIERIDSSSIAAVRTDGEKKIGFGGFY